MSSNKLAALQKSKYLEMVFCLWESGPEGANREYPEVSVRQFAIANAHYDTLRCEGCYCGSCVGLGEHLENPPKELKPLTDFAIRAGEAEYKAK